MAYMVIMEPESRELLHHVELIALVQANPIASKLLVKSGVPLRAGKGHVVGGQHI